MNKRIDGRTRNKIAKRKNGTTPSQRRIVEENVV
jgi:hypothetical protein